MEKNMVGVFMSIEKLNTTVGLGKKNVNKENVLITLSEIESVVDMRVNKLLQLIKNKKISNEMV